MSMFIQFNICTCCNHCSVRLPHEQVSIGLYRDVWIAAIASSTTSLATRTAAICVRFQGRHVRRVYVTMQITFLTRKSALIYRRDLRQRVASLTLNCNGVLAIRAYGSYIVTHFKSVNYTIQVSDKVSTFIDCKYVE